MAFSLSENAEQGSGPTHVANGASSLQTGREPRFMETHFRQKHSATFSQEQAWQSPSGSFHLSPGAGMTSCLAPTMAFSTCLLNKP